MANVMSLKSFMNKPKRNGFDLSFKNAFTAKAGELIPIMVKEVLPGDKFNIDFTAFTRTQPVNSAAFVRMRQYYDVFFVPYKLLWNRFYTFYKKLHDYQKDAEINTSVEEGEHHTYFTYNDIGSYLSSGWTATGDDLGNAANMFGFDRRQLTRKLLEYLGYLTPTNQTTLRNDVVMNPVPLLAYQKICQDFFRDDQWEKAAPWRYNLDYITKTSDLHIPVSSIDKDNYTMFDLNYCNYPKDYFMGMLPSPQYGTEAFVPFNIDFPSRLKVDQYFGSPISGSSQSYSLGGNTSNVSDESVPIGPTGMYKQNLLQAQLSSSQVLNNQVYLYTEIINSSSSGLSILALRQAEALQKWKEISQSGRQDYQTQMEKHWGVKPSSGVSNHCQYVGGWNSNLDINEVVNTNLSADTDQPDIMGKGSGTSQGGCEFSTNEHGVLMCIYHCIPLLDYSLDNCHKFNLKSNYTDYAIPEFDSVGMQQVSPLELDRAFFNANTGENYFGNQGWVPRYADYKTSIDEVHGAFKDTLKYWVAPFTDEYISSYQLVVSKLYGSMRLSYEFFKVNPSILDLIFGYNVDSSVNSDQFLVNSFFDIKVARNLDYNGLPY